MNQKSSKTSTSRVAMLLVLVPALAVAVLWLGMGQLSLSAVEIQDEASASVKAPTLVEDGGVVPALKNWEFTERVFGQGSIAADGHIIPENTVLANRVIRSDS